jgi:polyhydroxyalkanoate synthase
MISLFSKRSRGVTPRTAVSTWGPATLYRLKSERPRTHTVPVLLVPSIINRPWILDLREGQSLAANLLDAGLDVFVVDWGEPRLADAHLDFGSYALAGLRHMLAAVRAASGADAAHLFGYCLGGTFALAAATRLEGIASVCALATPVDLSQPGALGVLTDRRLLDIERLTAGYPIVPAAALWTSFQLLDPVGIERKWRGLFKRLRDRERRQRFLAQESWLSDPIPMTARAVRDVVRLYRENQLAAGTLFLEGAPVRLAEGRVPVLNLIAARDTLVPAAASRSLDGLWGGPVTTHTFSGGHIGVCVGSRAPEGMWRVAREWLRARQEACI